MIFEDGEEDELARGSCRRWWIFVLTEVDETLPVECLCSRQGQRQGGCRFAQGPSVRFGIDLMDSKTDCQSHLQPAARPPSADPGEMPVGRRCPDAQVPINESLVGALRNSCRNQLTSKEHRKRVESSLRAWSAVDRSSVTSPSGLCSKGETQDPGVVDGQRGCLFVCLRTLRAAERDAPKYDDLAASGKAAEYAHEEDGNTQHQVAAKGKEEIKLLSGCENVLLDRLAERG